MFFAAVVALLACGQSSSEPAEPAPENERPLAIPAEAADAADAPDAAGAEQVSVSSEGSRFEPAVEVAQIPDGAWMCDMGTVHYAQLTEGSCPICGMVLTQKAAAEAHVEH